MTYIIEKAYYDINFYGTISRLKKPVIKMSSNLFIFVALQRLPATEDTFIIKSKRKEKEVQNSTQLRLSFPLSKNMLKMLMTKKN